MQTLGYHGKMCLKYVITGEIATVIVAFTVTGAIQMYLPLLATFTLTGAFTLVPHRPRIATN